MPFDVPAIRLHVHVSEEIIMRYANQSFRPLKLRTQPVTIGESIKTIEAND